MIPAYFHKILLEIGLSENHCIPAICCCDSPDDTTIYCGQTAFSDTQYIIVQFQIIQRESYAQLHLIAKQFFKFSKASACSICFRFDFHRKDVIFSLNPTGLSHYYMYFLLFYHIIKKRRKRYLFSFNVQPDRRTVNDHDLRMELVKSS